jgi:hypothetical protein
MKTERRTRITYTPEELETALGLVKGERIVYAVAPGNGALIVETVRPDEQPHA